MVSSETAFAEQVPGFTEADVAKVTFFNEWLTVPDRVGWWVRHPEPPGDDAAAVARRIRAFAASFADRDDAPPVTVAVTHSPVAGSRWARRSCPITGRWRKRCGQPWLFRRCSRRWNGRTRS